MGALKNTFMAIMLASSGAAQAGQVFTGLSVTNIETGWSAEGVYVDVVGGLAYEGCSGRLRIEPNHPMLRIMVSQLMSALIGGLKVGVYVEGCAGPNLLNITSVSISK